jgi:crossover junction endodeoxyribonuclease RuvC
VRLLAIDPGYERLGIAILEKDAVIFSECYKTGAKLDFSERLGLLGKRIAEIIEKYKPETMAIETLFLTTNQKTAMRVAEARGVIMYEGEKAGLKIFEYTPLQIKIAVTSYGKADKKALMDMVKKLVKIDSNKTSDDELDAIAIGLTCLAREKTDQHGSVRQLAD